MKDLSKFAFSYQKPQQLMKLIKTIEKITDKKFKKYVGAIRDIKLHWILKIEKRFGKLSSISLHKGLLEFIEWYKTY